MFDTLPTEILREVVGVVHREHPPSVAALRRVNKTFHAASVAWELRSLKFEISRSKKLRKDVDRVLSVVQKSDGLRHVRVLCITGRWLAREKDELALEDWVDGESDVEVDHETVMNGEKWSLQSHILDKSVAELRLSVGPPIGGGPVIFTATDEFLWRPLVDFMKALDHLGDLIFDSLEQFPPSLLDVLHQYHPRCRLHLPKFRFRSLREDVTDAHEMAVVTSPNLYSLGVSYVWRGSDGHDDYNNEAVMKLIEKGLMPRLKHLRLTHTHAASSYALMQSRGRPRQPWKGFSTGPWDGNAQSDHREPIESLALDDISVIRPDVLQTWQTTTAFDTLTDLAIGGLAEESLLWIAANNPLPNLSNLRLRLERNDETELRPGFTDAAIMFFHAIQPLQTLNLYGAFDKPVFDALIDRHGATLTDLVLNPDESMYSRSTRNNPYVFTLEDFEHLRDSSPRLTDLRIPIKRQMGSAKEVNMYRILAGLPSLTNLDIMLDCSNPLVTVGQGDEGQDFADPWMALPWEQNRFTRLQTVAPRCVRNGNMYEAFANCAVDEKLARSIWSVINESKHGHPVRKLNLHTQGVVDFGSNSYRSDVRDMAVHMGRSYQLDRGVRDDEDGAQAVHVEELGRAVRVKNDEKERLREAQGDDVEKDGPGSRLHVFRKLWPVKVGALDWREDWGSLPLQV